jgi:hypothetical protein
MDSLRNLAIGILHARRCRNIDAGLRGHARDATRLLPLRASPACVPDTPAVPARWASR